jgi:uncharacterized membrane protein YagU involved in acid resistance
MPKSVTAIVLGGLAAGVLDILYAIIVFGPLTYGLPAQRVLQSIDAGWIGREAARAGGWTTALQGLASHFMLTIIMASAFVFAARALPALTKRPILWGFLYGLVLMVAMNYFVVPLSAAATGHFASSLSEAGERISAAFAELPGDATGNPIMFAGTILTHTMLVGVPIALIAKRFAPQQT